MSSKQQIPLRERKGIWNSKVFIIHILNLFIYLSIIFFFFAFLLLFLSFPPKYKAMQVCQMNHVQRWAHVIHHHGYVITTWMRIYIRTLAVNCCNATNTSSAFGQKCQRKRNLQSKKKEKNNIKLCKKKNKKNIEKILNKLHK